MGKVKEIKLQAEDLVCAACVEDMEQILLETKGIINASVNFKDDTIVIRYDPEITDRKKVYVAARRLSNITEIISET